MAIIDSVKLPDNSTYDLTDNYSGYQKETLATPITVDGTSETTVEGALGAVNDYADKIEGSMSNENLVDNGWFTVNQRGVTSGDFIPTNTYVFDRWKKAYSGNGAATWALTSSGLSVNTNNEISNCRFDQPFETILDATRTYTASVLLSDGTIVQGTGKPEFTVASDDFSLVVNASFFRISFPKEKQVTIRAVKLELGTVSTLANDVAPNPTTELLKCQRFFYRILAGADTPLVAIGYAIDATRCRATILLPTKMRTGLPSVSFYGTFQINSDDTSHNVAAVDSVQVSNGNLQPLTLTTSGLTAGHLCALILSNTGYIDFSADL